MPDLLKEIGDRIKRLRIAKGLNQDQLGKKAGITQKTVSNIESGHQDMSVKTLTGIAEALSTTRLSLLGETPPAPKSKSTLIGEIILILSDFDESKLRDLLGVIQLPSTVHAEKLEKKIR